MVVEGVTDLLLVPYLTSQRYTPPVTNTISDERGEKCPLLPTPPTERRDYCILLKNIPLCSYGRGSPRRRIRHLGEHMETRRTQPLLPLCSVYHLTSLSRHTPPTRVHLFDHRVGTPAERSRTLLRVRQVLCQWSRLSSLTSSVSSSLLGGSSPVHSQRRFRERTGASVTL